MRNNTLMTMLLVCLIGSLTASNNTLGTLTVNPEKVLSTETVTPVVDLEFMPNATEDLVKINNASPINEIRVYNAKGTLVSKKTHLSKAYDFDTSNLSAGTYCFIIQIDKKVVTKIVEKT